MQKCVCVYIYIELYIHTPVYICRAWDCCIPELLVYGDELPDRKAVRGLSAILNPAMHGIATL